MGVLRSPPFTCRSCVCWLPSVCQTPATSAASEPNTFLMSSTPESQETCLLGLSSTVTLRPAWEGLGWEKVGASLTFLLVSTPAKSIAHTIAFSMFGSRPVAVVDDSGAGMVPASAGEEASNQSEMPLPLSTLVFALLSAALSSAFLLSANGTTFEGASPLGKSLSPGFGFLGSMW